MRFNDRTRSFFHNLIFIEGHKPFEDKVSTNFTNKINKLSRKATKFMSITLIRKSLTYFIAAVWLYFGLFCKVLNFQPRHEQIVARILGNEYAHIFTKAIGVSEILMAIWVLSGIRSRFCTITQITLVATMNTIEFFYANDLLLFGKTNAFVAVLFIGILGIRFQESGVRNQSK